MLRKIIGSILIIADLGLGWFGLQVLLAGHVWAIFIILAGLSIVFLA